MSALIHQHVTHNRHDPTQKQFANAILGFLRETIPNEWKTFPSPVAIPEEMRRHSDRNLISARRPLEREVIFRQTHPLEQQGMSDFFQADSLNVTIAGQPFPHRIDHLTLVCSGWEHAEVVPGGESFTALTCGLQNALWQLGGVPRDPRTDSLPAAFVTLNPDAREDLRKRFEALCADDGMEPTRNNRGIAHENGSIESRHGHLKVRLEQAQLLRGSRDFEDVEAWRRFVARVIARHNAQRREQVDLERAGLLPLPAKPNCDYDAARIHVTSSGRFVFRKVFDTVPSRLIGYQLNLRADDDRLELFAGNIRTATLPRGRAPDHNNGKHGHVVNHHHVIHRPGTKPGAFANLTYRDAVFPGTEYRRVREALVAAKPVREASRTILDLLWTVTLIWHMNTPVRRNSPSRWIGSLVLATSPVSPGCSYVLGRKR